MYMFQLVSAIISCLKYISVVISNDILKHPHQQQDSTQISFV